jgi:hypothetical protein
MDRNIRHRWLTSSCASLFIGIALCGCLFAYQLNWVKQRNTARADRGFEFGRVVPSIQLVGAPMLLRVFGEPGVPVIIVNDNLPEAEVWILRSLFPEAELLN